jgi:rhodanese-related sulfurtransferase
MSDVPQPARLALKLFADPDPGPGLALEPFIGLFHRFIQQKQLEGLLIDVADYAHVPDGPGILLVGHEVDYGIGRSGGRTRLLTTRKRCAGLPFADSLRDTLRKALSAALAVEASGVGDLRFDTGELRLELLDRLAAPNRDEAARTLQAPLESVLAAAYGDARLELARVEGDARAPLGFRVRAANAPPAAALLARLGGSAAAAADEPAQSPWDVSVEELKRLRDTGVDFVLLDVREEREYAICHLDGRLLPLGSLPGRVGELDASAHIVVHCRSGVRSAKAVELLRAAGFENAWNVRGGILAWIERIDPSLTRY